MELLMCGSHLPTGTVLCLAASTQNYSIAFGGNQNPTIVGTTVEYDGTGTDSRNSLGTAVEKHNAGGDGSNGLSFSGGLLLVEQKNLQVVR